MSLPFGLGLLSSLIPFFFFVMNRFLNFRPIASAPQSPAFAGRLARRSGPVLRIMLLVAAFGLRAAAPARAQAPTGVQMTQPDASSLRLRFDNPTRRPAYLTVVHLNNGEAILNETHREAAYATRLKFDRLPAGTYAVLLRVGRDRYRYAVQVAADAAGNPAVAVRETTTHRVESGLVTARL